MKTNRIPRNFNHLLVEAKTSNNASNIGDRFIVTKDECGRYIGTNMQTHKEWQMFVSHLRNPNYYELIDVA